MWTRVPKGGVTGERCLKDRPEPTARPGLEGAPLFSRRERLYHNSKRSAARPKRADHGEVQMKTTGKHVVPNPAGGWAVRNSGAARVSRIFATQAEAIKYGRAAAEKAHSDLYILGRDGMVKSKDCYGVRQTSSKNDK